MKIVLVEWTDSTMLGTRWHCEDEIDQLDIGRCVSVGIIRQNDDDKMVLVQNQGRYRDGANLIALPKGCIKSIRQLKVSPSDKVSI